MPTPEGVPGEAHQMIDTIMVKVEYKIIVDPYRANQEVILTLRLETKIGTTQTV